MKADDARPNAPQGEVRASLSACLLRSGEGPDIGDVAGRLARIAAALILDFRRRWKAHRRLLIPALAGIGGILAIVAADHLFPPPLYKAEPYSPLVLDRDGRWLHAFTTPDGRWRFRADLDSIDAEFLTRLVAVEDQRFWRHIGVDPLALARAAATSLGAGRIVSGGSTITMQTARLLEPRPRTIGSKLVEMFRALQIERRLSKREILELYLTLAPYGGNIEGVRAASLLYFNHEPARLSDAEQALLIALPQAPEARRPDRRPDAARAARNREVAEFVRRGLLNGERGADAIDAPLPAKRAPFSRAAYHAARALALRLTPEDRGGVRSTIDLRLQRRLEALVRAHAAKPSDGATAALIVVDNRTRAVRALVGSSSVDAAGGWIDLTSAVRSPGSTLKPFIYGIAFDEGIIGPDTVIDDMPQSFDGYSPENFDRAFRGEVKVADALQRSLNLPAVRVLERIGAPRLAASLSAAGIAVKAPRRADRPVGLTLALGGAGVTMRDLAALYAGLADGGLAAPLRWTAADEAAPSADGAFSMFATESAYRINEILAEGPALEGRLPPDLSQAAPRIAYKTGTSYGYRDAWSAGHSGAYTVVAWVGRADGASRPGETGRKAAAPLMMEAFDAVAAVDPAAALRAAASDDAPIAISRFSAPRRAQPPEIVFPRDGVEVYAESDRGFALAARGGAGGYRWYVRGDPIETDAVTGRALWRPEAPGFYDLVVVDRDGKAARATVRVAR